MKFTKQVPIGVLSLALVGLWLNACASAPPDAVPLIAERCPSSVANCRPLFREGAGEPTDRYIDLYETLISGLEKAQGQPEKIIDALSTEDSRLALLEIQGVARLYEEMPYVNKSKERKNEIKRVKEVFEDLESKVGSVERYQGLLKRIQGGATRAELAAVEAKVKIARGELVEFMSKRKKDEIPWLPDPVARLREEKEKIEKFGFKEAAKDKRQIIASLAKSADKTRDELDAKDVRKIFEMKDLSEADLDAGPHFMRRKLRWFTTMMRAARGVFIYRRPLSPNARLRQLTQEVGSSKYTRLSPPLDDPAQLEMEPVYEIARLVTQLGNLKDFKESLLDLEDIFHEMLGMKRKEAGRRAFAILRPQFPELGIDRESRIEDKLRESYAEYRTYDPLKQLVRNLEDELERVKRADGD